MRWELHLRDRAKKAAGRLPKKDRIRIAKALDELMDDPYVGDIEKLEGEENSWRRRSGAYRIKFQIMTESKIIFVYEIERRSSKTY